MSRKPTDTKRIVAALAAYGVYFAHRGISVNALYRAVCRVKGGDGMDGLDAVDQWTFLRRWLDEREAAVVEEKPKFMTRPYVLPRGMLDALARCEELSKFRSVG